MMTHKSKYMLGKVLWIVSALSFLVSWGIVIYGAPVLGLDPLLLLWTALVLGVLAIPLKMDCGNSSCSPRSGDMGGGMPR